MKQYTENQYDDDLTVGTDEYDDSYYTGSVDLFEFSSDEESPISRLKSLILSIDWEITDEILMQFNEELVDLRNIWAGEKINLVYVQALEKISKYIYQKKADSHPSAIKLLLTLYHNLEKIVSSYDLSEEQKKEILLEDVKRFESLKYHISKQSETIDKSKTAKPKPHKETGAIFFENDLLNLKAIVLGIDWEITDQDLNELRQEVVRLEGKFADNRPRLILLQGIGTLAAYIKLKKSNAHADAFKLLHLFYESLEKIVVTPMKLEEEKAILFPAVEKFNSFKTLLGPTIAPEAIDRHEKEIDEDYSLGDSATIAPAFSDIPEDETMGFQAEEEAKSLGFQSAGSVDEHVESFFVGTSFQSSEPQIPVDAHLAANGENYEIALQGVDVEVDQEKDADDVVQHESDTLASDLSMESEGQIEVEPSTSGFHKDVSVQDEELVDVEDSISLPTETLADAVVDSYFGDMEEEKTELDFSKLDKNLVLQGVDVETEADDDSDEEALPLMEGELAPALAGNDEVSIFNAEIFEKSAEIQNIDDEIAGTLGGFFDEEIESHFPSTPALEEADLDIISEPVVSAVDSMENGGHDDSLSPAASHSLVAEGWADEERIEEDVLTPFAMEETAAPEVELVIPIDKDQTGVVPEAEQQLDFESELELAPETEIEDDDEAIAFVSELEQEDHLSDFFGASEFEPTAEDRLAEEQEEDFSDIDSQLDSFFDIGEDVEEPAEDRQLFTQPDETAADAGITVDEGMVSTAPVLQDIKDDYLPEDEVQEAEVQEDEVVFELVEEVGFLSDSEPRVEVSEKKSFDELLTGKEDISSSDLIVETEDDNIEELPGKTAPVLETEITADAYGTLRVCVESLGVELDDKVILGLWKEIDQLHQNLTDKPLEKTFLQLLSTITRHIDQNRYDSSPDAYVLLQSVCSALTKLQEDDLLQNQELLLTETHKVLKWQEELLAQQAAQDEAELTIGDDLSITADDQEVTADDVITTVLDQGEYEDATRFDQEQKRLSVGSDSKIIADDLKQEISTLRKTLQEEIAELRRELKGNYP